MALKIKKKQQTISGHMGIQAIRTTWGTQENTLLFWKRLNSRITSQIKRVLKMKFSTGFPIEDRDNEITKVGLLSVKILVLRVRSLASHTLIKLHCKVLYQSANLCEARLRTLLGLTGVY